MKKSIFSLLILLITSSISAQDLIVTNSGDSINCKITKVKSNYIYFTFQQENEIRKTLIPIDETNNFKRNYYKNLGITIPQPKKTQGYKQTRFAINTGFSYQTAKISENVPNNLKDYIKKLKTGIHFEADFHYYISESFGYGIQYIFFHTSGTSDKVPVTSFGSNTNWVKMKDNLNISFIGPSVSTRFYNRDKSGAFLLNSSIGYMGYRNKKVILTDYLIIGSTLGTALSFGYDFGLSKKTNFGVQLTATSGVLRRYKIDDGNSIQSIELDSDEYEGLGRLDLSLGIRF